MENKIEYVLYESEKNNEYINKLKPLHPAVKKIKRTENGVVMESFYDFSKFKNVRTLSELSRALNENEYLIIDLNVIKEKDSKLKEEEKLYDKIKETINEANIIPYVYHILEKKQKNERNIGDKLYLIKYDELYKLSADVIKNSDIVQIKMNEDQTCLWESISFTSKHKKELDEELFYRYGAYSGLYCLIPEEAKEDLDSYYEITKTEEGTWDFIKKNNAKNK